MKPAPFTYHKATTVADALRLLARYPEGRVLAGGQSLIPLMNFRLSRPSDIIDIGELATLRTMEPLSGGALRIGALVTHQRLVEEPAIRAQWPVLSQAAGHIGHWAIRNRGTLGGSVAHADARAELPAAMVSLDATVVVASERLGERRVRAADFFLGMFTTVLDAGDLVVAVEVPANASRWGFFEVARKSGDFAVAGAFVELTGDGGAVTWFGVAEAPEKRRFDPARAVGRGRPYWAELLGDVAWLDDDPYRRAMAEVAAERAFWQARTGKTPSAEGQAG